MQKSMLNKDQNKKYNLGKPEMELLVPKFPITTKLPLYNYIFRKNQI